MDSYIEAGTIVNVMFNERMGRYTRYALVLTNYKQTTLHDVRSYVLINIDHSESRPSYTRYKNSVKFKHDKHSSFSDKLSISELRSAFFRKDSLITVGLDDQVYVIAEPIGNATTTAYYNLFR